MGVLVSSYSLAREVVAKPFLTDQISLNFIEFEMEYKEQKSDGTPPLRLAP